MSREAVYQWFIRWLNNGQGDYHEQPAKIYPNHELLVTPTGRVEDIAGSRKVHQLILDDLQAKRKPGTTAELVAELRRLKIPTDGSAPALKLLSEKDNGDYRSQRIQWESEPGVEIEGALYIPSSPGRKQAVLLVAGEHAEALAATLVKAGRVVLKVEPRTSVSEAHERPFVGNWMVNTRVDQIGLCLPAMRAHDLLRGVDVLAARDDVDVNSIRAAAYGVKGIWVLLAAAVDPRIRKVWLDKTPYSLLEALNNAMDADLSDAMIYGFALHWELEDLTKAMGDRPVFWTDPTNWMGRVANAGRRFHYRWVLGDLTDMSDAQDVAFFQEFIK